jgi:hypothetical protein
MASATPGRALTRLFCALQLILLIASGSNAQGSLTAHYTMSMTGVSIGEIAWLVDIGKKNYSTSATGKASRVLSVLVNGEGSVETSGAVGNGIMTPLKFVSHIADDEGDTELQVIFENGVARPTIIHGPTSKPDRLPVADSDLRGVSDPLTAMLVSANTAGSILGASSCDRALLIFDGRRRYNLALAFLRMDEFKADKGYSGPVLVCSVVLQPIAGYKRDSLLVKYVAGRRDMELWFAPIAGTTTIAPIQVSMPTLIGTLKIVADKFQSIATKPAAPAPVDAVPPATPR